MTASPRIPEPEGLHAEFYAQAQDRVLRIKRCADCSTFQHPPRFICHRCSSPNFAWVPSRGWGTLYSWTTTHRMVDSGWTDVPYSTGVVELDGQGVRLVGALDVPPAELRLGLPLEVVLSPRTDTFVFLTLRAR